jgi:phosphoribosyl 1,2-cyclic phosphodiesterase
VEVVVLASGSSGNSTLVRSGGCSLLVDVGISALQIRRRMEQFGHTAAEVSAVLLSHEHSDHVRGLEVLLKRDPMAVWATAGTWSSVPVHASSGGELSSGRSLRIGPFKVLPVATSHDAREPVAFMIDDGDHRLALCTDTGVFTGLLSQRLAGCDLLLIETNHDADMLRNGPYPWPLKQRIASRTGHLANHQSAEAVDRLRSSALKAVLGLHLSAENNLPELALQILNRCVHADVPVHAVPRSEMLRTVVEADQLSFERLPVPPPGRRASKDSS